MNSDVSRKCVCQAPGCNNKYLYSKSKLIESKSFFRFPLQDKQRCFQWVTFSKLIDTWQKSTFPYRNHYLCSDHFELKYFTSTLKNKLYPNAIPTVYTSTNASPSNNTNTNKSEQDTFPNGNSKNVLENIQKTNLSHAVSVTNKQTEKRHAKERVMQGCAAPDCDSYPGKDKNLLFHTFPFDNPPLLQLWIKALNRENWKPFRYDIICSNHFYNSDYQIEPDNIKFLKRNAVPKLFNKVTNNTKLSGTAERPCEVIYIIADDSENFQLNNNNKNRCTIADLPEDIDPSTLLLYTESPVKKVRTKHTQTNSSQANNYEASIISTQITELKGEINMLQLKLKRRDLKIKNMCQIIKHLKSRHS